MEHSKYADPPRSKEENQELSANPQAQPPPAPSPSNHTLNPQSAVFELPSRATVDSIGSLEDEFAQTRAPDDLFDDDFTPIAEPSVETVISPDPVLHGGHAPGGRGQRGAARGRGGRRDNGQAERKDEAKVTDANGTAANGDRPSSVRGDRSGTGGVKKPKLSEDELSARLASIKLKNAAREEAHRRAEADEASFQQRERQEQAKRREERANRQVMEGERERNRLRKMKAAQAREWDAEKKEEDQVGDRRSNGSQFRRGAYGGVVGGSSGHHNGSDEPADGRAGEFEIRGRGRGRGRGRAGRYHDGPSHGFRGSGDARNGPPNPKAESDFPALPVRTPPVHEKRAPANAPGAKAEQPLTQATLDSAEKKSSQEMTMVEPTGPDAAATWAEQVESNAPPPTVSPAATGP